MPDAEGNFNEIKLTGGHEQAGNQPNIRELLSSFHFSGNRGEGATFHLDEM